MLQAARTNDMDATPCQRQPMVDTAVHEALLIVHDAILLVMSLAHALRNPTKSLC